MEVCHRVPARIATQNSCGKRSIFSTKQIGMKKSHLSGTLEHRAYPQNHLSDGPNSPYRLWPLQKDSGGPIDHRDNNAFCVLFFPIVHSALRINYHIGILVYSDFLKGSPLERGQNLQIGLGKTRNVTHLLAWIDDITCCCEGPRDPLRGVAGLQSRIVCKICEK